MRTANVLVVECLAKHYPVSFKVAKEHLDWNTSNAAPLTPKEYLSMWFMYHNRRFDARYLSRLADILRVLSAVGVVKCFRDGNGRMVYRWKRADTFDP